MVKRLFPLLLFFTTRLLAQPDTPPIGGWREHLPWNQAIDLAASGDQVFCASPYAVFSISLSGNEIERFSTVTGLSETGVAALAWDPAGSRLMIAYQNSNLDIVTGDRVINIPDIARSPVTADKSIYRIYPAQSSFFLVTGLGIIVIDGDKYEVKDTWYIGAGGGPVRTNAFASDAQYYYAATEEGLKRVSRSVSNPGNYLSWQVLSGSNGLAPGPCQDIVNFGNHIIANVHDSLWQWDGSQWKFFYANGTPITRINPAGDQLLLTQPTRLTVLSPAGTSLSTTFLLPPASSPANALLIANQTWMADRQNGLVRFRPGGYDWVRPQSPGGIVLGQLVASTDNLFAAAGTVDANGQPGNNRQGIFALNQGQWRTLDRTAINALDSLPDLVALTVDPSDNTLWAGSFGGGLAHFDVAEQSVKVYKQGFLRPAISSPGSYRVGGLVFDQGQQLWVTNSGAAEPLAVRSRDGGWRNISIPLALSDNAVSQILIDLNQYKWILAPKANAIVCFDDGGTPASPADDKWKMYASGTGKGNLPAGLTRCIARDRNDFIWVGTSNGIGVIQCSADVFTAAGCEAIWPVVQQGNFAGYLFAGEDVQSIAVDGADRKWIGTKNGAWLISPGGDKIIYHFTTTNSPLLSDDVRQIVVDGISGEVFFATAKGLCSFRGTATEGGNANQHVLVFPNPVPPGYGGTIAIRGLVENALVKITELNGRLVFQTRALGGQAIWNGRDYQGRKIETGIYLVLVSGEDHRDQFAARIIFISR